MKPNNKKIKFWNHYYNKLMLVNTAIVCVVTVVYGMVATQMASTYERVNQLKSYEYALNQLHIDYSNKQENFNNLMLTLYDDRERFHALSALIEMPSPDLATLSAFNRQSITRLLLSLCNKDADIHSVFILKSNTQSWYSYTPTTNILERLDNDSPLFRELSTKDYPRTVYGARMLPQDDDGVFIYGIGGNLSSEASSILRKPASILVAYTTNALHHNLQNKDLPFGGRFLILTENGELIFDSVTQNLQKQDKTIFAGYQELYGSNGFITLSGEDYYVSTIKDEKRGFLSAYMVPKQLVDSGSRNLTWIIVMGAFIFFGISIFIYFLSSKFSTKRLALLETAMTQIGSNNLSYRIPVHVQRDEFAVISKRFNDMCDELEDNIQRAYIYHLRQKSAELHALQATINPHFLYNTLEAIRGRLVQDGNQDAADMVVILSRLYRSQIKGKDVVTIREELNQCNMYLELFSLRHNNNLSFLFRVSNELAKYAIPKNTIQPILENYLVHGLRDENNQVEIHAERRGEDILITIMDNGRGILPKALKRLQKTLGEKSRTSENGIGLSNVNDRIKIVYGEAYGLEVSQRQNQPGTVVRLLIRALTVSEMEARYGNTTDSSVEQIDAQEEEGSHV